MKKFRKVTSFKQTVINYIISNSKEYILVTLIFIIGIFIGVMFINNSSSQREILITQYISEFIEKFKNIEQVDSLELTTSSIKNNMYLALIVWIAGTTIIGMPIVLGIILFRGFCLGYTIASVTYTLGVGKGILFCLLTLFLQNILFIPAILTIGVSSIKLYKSIVADRRKENIKIEIIRHTIISFLMLVVLVISSIVENRISIKLLQMGIKYI